MSPAGHAAFRAGLALPAFAKINLSLELLGPRSDGYTEIRTVYQTLTLHDRLWMRRTRSARGVVVRVPGGGAPAGRENLVHRALRRALASLGLAGGIEVELEKHIPAARGLGGGSSDAAAALIGLLRLAGARLTRHELMGLGTEVGADVGFFFRGGRALGVGRGDQVHPLPDGATLTCVLLCPPQPVETRLAYRWAARRPGRARLTLREGAGMIKRSRWFPDEFWAGPNDFEPVVFSRFPELARMKAALLRAGARHAGLSGSGSTVYALFARRAAAERAAAPWVGGATVFMVETLPRERYQRALGLSRVIRKD